jgi:hypothetical protein
VMRLQALAGVDIRARTLAAEDETHVRWHLVVGVEMAVGAFPSGAQSDKRHKVTGVRQGMCGMPGRKRMVRLFYLEAKA